MKDLLFPNRCIFCGALMQADKLICRECAAQDIMIVGSVCKFCGLSTERCDCGKRRYFYERRIACVYYEGNVPRGIARFKFYCHTMLGVYYGRMMAQNVRSKYKDIHFDWVLYVPMRPFDRWRRGYNCAQVLAEEISKNCGIPLLLNGLYKRRRTKPQKRMKYHERAGNVADAFSTKCADRLAGKTVLLVDDVATSGATLNECAKILKLAGAAKVYCATMAAVPPRKNA